MVALIVGGFLFLDASSLLCYCPLQFILPAVLTLAAAIFGLRWVRITGIFLCLASVAMGIQHYQKKEHLDAMVRAVHERSATNSVSK